MKRYKCINPHSKYHKAKLFINLLDKQIYMKTLRVEEGSEKQRHWASMHQIYD